MKMKKIGVIVLLTIFLISILSISTNASIGSILDQGMGKISGMMNQQKSQTEQLQASKVTTGIAFYDNNSTIIDFFIFFMLFLSAAFFGLKNQIKEGGSAAKGMAIAIGAALSIAAVKAGMGPTFFIPFVKNIVLFITVIVLYMVMSGPLKFPRWLAFILAPLITFLLFFFVGGSADNLLGTDILSGITTGTDQEKIIQIDQQIAEKQREVGQILAIFKAEDVLPSTLTTDTKAEDITSTQLEAINSMILQKYKPGPLPPSGGIAGGSVDIAIGKPPKQTEMETHLDRLKTLISQIKALKAEKDKILKTPTTPGTTGTTGTITQTELPTCDESQNFDATKCKCRGTTQPTGYCCKGRYFPTVKSAAECPEQDILKEALEAIDTLNK